MASGPITLWQIKGEEMEVATEFIFLSSKSLLMVTAAMKLKAACSLEAKLTNLDSALKSWDVNLLTKVCIVKAMVFPVVMHCYENWSIKKADG